MTDDPNDLPPPLAPPNPKLPQYRPEAAEYGALRQTSSSLGESVDAAETQGRGSDDVPSFIARMIRAAGLYPGNWPGWDAG